MTALSVRTAARSGWTLPEPFGMWTCVRAMSLPAFTERYRKWCKRHGYNFSQSRAVEIHTDAQDLIAMLPRLP